LKHLGAFGVFALLAVAWSFPLASHVTNALPGPAVGDNAMFFWNFWWMRTALAQGRDFFQTPFLFAPVGADLTLHTHTALPAFVGATLLGRLSALTALNLATLASLALDGFCAYLLAWQVSRHRGAALIGGLIFATSPYLAAHLNGHFNLIAAWPLPLFALAVGPALDSSGTSGFTRTGAAAAAGLLVALTAYIDYYYVVFELGLLACVLVVDASDWSLRLAERRTASFPLVLVLAVAALDLAAIVAVTMTGGFTGQVFGVRISMTDTYNPLQIFWVLGIVAAALWWRPRPAIRIDRRWSLARSISALTILAVVFLGAAGPLLWKGLVLAARGRYVTQQYYWRSAPPGVDAATLLLGNPFHGLWGSAIQRLYGRLGTGINAIEQAAWLGLVPCLLAAFALIDRSGERSVRRWGVVGAIFMIWALGPHLRIAGHDTGMILPQAFLRYVPVVSNARVPGRAVIVVMLAVSVLAAIGTARLTTMLRPQTVVLSAIAAFILVDFMAAPYPLTSVSCPQLYGLLRNRPEQGALAELPVSVGDGFGEIAPVDNHMLLCQAVHGRPLVGGFIARIPSNVTAFYETDPLLRAWVRLSGGNGDAPAAGIDPAAAADRLHADGIAFIMLNRDRSSSLLREQVSSLPLTVIGEDDHRTLYAVR